MGYDNVSLRDAIIASVAHSCRAVVLGFVFARGRHYRARLFHESSSSFLR